jgi:uncharacterized protein (DUF1501 family)
MTDQPKSPYTRREFIGRSLTFASASLTVPAFLQRSAFAMAQPAPGLGSIPGINEDRILVVLQLSGGNDGLNTVVPFGFDQYYRVRPGIGINANAALKLSKSDGVGLHPALTGLHDLHEEGMLSILQGVGYPNPNRSHFKSMDIWHTADTTGSGDGWLGRYVDSQCCGAGKGESGTPEPAQAALVQPPIAIGRNAPLALQARKMVPVSFESADLFRWTGQDVSGSLGETYEKIIARDVPPELDPSSNAAFLMRTALDARVSSDRIRQAVGAKPLVEYPRTGVARDLSMVASMIRAELPTRVYYVSMGGYDTHAGQGGQQGSHANLLRHMGESLKAFYADLKAQGNEARVLTMCFSEFGRRVAQNASGGTDHGTAAPVFLAGPMVRPGLIGDHPSLTDLDDGDLKHQLDFRSVYAGILKDWLQAKPEDVLGRTFRPAVLFRKA